ISSLRSSGMRLPFSTLAVTVIRTGRASLGVGVFAVTGKVDRTMATRDMAKIERCILVILFIFVFPFTQSLLTRLFGQLWFQGPFRSPYRADGTFSRA